MTRRSFQHENFAESARIPANLAEHTTRSFQARAKSMGSEEGSWPCFLGSYLYAVRLFSSFLLFMFLHCLPCLLVFLSFCSVFILSLLSFVFVFISCCPHISLYLCVGFLVSSFCLYVFLFFVFVIVFLSFLFLLVLSVVHSSC